MKPKGSDLCAAVMALSLIGMPLAVLVPCCDESPTAFTDAKEDFEWLHKFLLETESLSEVSDDMRELVEEEWPELAHKLPPRAAPSSG